MLRSVLDALFDFETFDFSRGGAGQIFLRDFIAADALGRSDLLRKVFDIEADDLLCVDNFLLAENVKVGYDDGVQAIAFSRLSFDAHDCKFLDEGGFQIVCFDFFGINILPVAENDDFFLASGEEQIAVAIEISEIAGIKPAIAENCSGCIGTVPVTFHDDTAAQGDLTGAGMIVELRIRRRRVDDPGFDSLHCFAN